MSLLAQVVEERRGDVVVARVSGEIDASNAPWLDERLRAAISNEADGLLVDLTRTSYLDSAAIALLFGLATALRQHQQQLALVVPEGSPIARMVQLTGLAETVPAHPTLEAALAES